MIVWSDINEKKLERALELIEQLGFHSGYVEENSLEELREILKNDTLDLDRDMHEDQMPLLVAASNWTSIDSIKELLSYGVNVNKTFHFNPFYPSFDDGEVQVPEIKNSLDILLEQKQQCVAIIQDKEYTSEVRSLFERELSVVEECIYLLVKHGAKISIDD